MGLFGISIVFHQDSVDFREWKGEQIHLNRKHSFRFMSKQPKKRPPVVSRQNIFHSISVSPLLVAVAATLWTSCLFLLFLMWSYVWISIWSRWVLFLFLTLKGLNSIGGGASGIILENLTWRWASETRSLLRMILWTPRLWAVRKVPNSKTKGFEIVVLENL